MNRVKVKTSILLVMLSCSGVFLCMLPTQAATTSSSGSSSSSVSSGSTSGGTTSSGSSSPAKPVPSKAPLGAPPQDEATAVYTAFRTKLYGDARCQDFATQSDTVFFDNTMSDADKLNKMKDIAAAAGTADCLMP